MEYPNEVIKLGYNNPEVLEEVKVKLNELGFGPLSPNISNFGLVTMQAVKKFQKANHLVQDGEIGELTWERLFKPVIIEKYNTVSLPLKALEEAKTQLFVRELTNHNDGKEVAEYLKSIGLGQGYSWCMAYMYWCFSKAAKELKIDCPVPKTGGVLECLRLAKPFVITSPKVGSQFIMDFGSGKGHTGIVTAISADRVYTIEGNTSADPSYAGEDRDGNGVFERNRKRNTIKAYISYSNIT